MYIPPLNNCQYSFEPPVLIDSRTIAFADPYYMSNYPSATNQSKQQRHYHDHHNQDLCLHKDPQKYHYNTMSTLMPDEGSSVATNMRRQSSSSSAVTMVTCSSFSNHNFNNQIIATSSYSGQHIDNVSLLNAMQDKLDTLYDEWISVDIVYRSLQTAFPVHPLVQLTHEERLEDIDRELSIAYDDLMTQVRRLYRNINRLSREMAQYNIQQDELQALQQQTPHIYANSFTPP